MKKQTHRTENSHLGFYTKMEEILINKYKTCLLFFKMGSFNYNFFMLHKHNAALLL